MQSQSRFDANGRRLKLCYVMVLIGQPHGWMFSRLRDHWCGKCNLNRQVSRSSVPYVMCVMCDTCDGVGGVNKRVSK
jgi:hypothetical protein